MRKVPKRRTLKVYKPRPAEKQPKFHWRAGTVNLFETQLKQIFLDPDNRGVYHLDPDMKEHAREFIEKSLNGFSDTDLSPSQKMPLKNLLNLTKKKNFGLNEVGQILGQTCFFKWDLKE